MKHLFTFTLWVCCVATSVFSQEHFQTAQTYLSEHYSELGLTSTDIQDVTLSSVSPSKKSGLTHVYLDQRWQGIPIYNGTMGIHLDADNQVFWVSNQFVPSLVDKINTTEPSLSQNDALTIALEQMEIKPTSSPSVLQNNGGAEQEVVFDKGIIAAQDIPVKLAFFYTPEEEVKLCWLVSIYQADLQHFPSFRIDALTGDIIDQNDFVISCQFGPELKGNGWDRCAEHNAISHDHSAVPKSEAPPVHIEKVNNPDAYRVFPEPYESPNHGPHTVMVNPADPASSPFGWHDTDGNPGAEFTYTRGNNVLTQEDINGNNGNGARPNGGASLDFLYTVDLNSQPNAYTEAVSTNLFYWNNLVHDVLWHYGFDEPSGNFQSNNYGNGGTANDYVLADAQDGSGTDNANMATQADGNRPRMQMYLWGGVVSDLFTVNSPAPIAGTYLALEGTFGPFLTGVPITGNLVEVDDGTAPGSDACEPPFVNAAAINGNIALIDRGTCFFADKVIAAENAGAVACVVCNNALGGPIAMGGGPPNPTTAPAVMISKEDCDIIRAQLGAGVNITLVNNGASPDRDGSFDNGIIAHEYGHGVSMRLTGGRNTTNCLNSGEQMGEGWSDWIGLFLTQQAGDVSTKVRGIGTYATSQPTNGWGIRPFPYTTDMSVNPATYFDINTVSVPHGVGFVWCSMLWEMNWLLIDMYGFDPDFHTGTGGNNIAMQLVIEGLKFQPCNPGFEDGRDAILAADNALYGGAHQCLIWNAFAKRGLGFSANQVTTGIGGNEVEAYDLPPGCLTMFGLEFVDVNATALTSSIKVDWKTAFEENIGKFQVWRKAEDQDAFELIHTTDQYVLEDENVSPNTTYYYQIKNLDKNGELSTSRIVNAKIVDLSQTQIAVFPSPANGKLFVEILGTQEVAGNIQLMDILGQELMERSLEGSNSSSPIQFNIESLPEGVYFVKFTSENQSITQKFIISR